ncbi:MAG: preprotein translocase subunit SecY [Spirochaetota bacterium]
MASPITNIFKIPELRSRVFFTLGALIVYRIGAHIPTPGIDPAALLEYFEKNGSGLLGTLDLFSGGALFKFTIFALGIMPYITASIVMQLLTVMVPAIERLQKEGEQGRKKINQYTRYMTIVFCAVQSFALANWIKGIEGGRMVYFENPGIGFLLLVVITSVTGTLFLVWLGEQITERGIGNGTSLIIYAGIAARIPQTIVETVAKVQTGDFNALAMVLMFAIFAVVIFFVVFEESGQRRIPVQYAKRVIGNRVYGAQNTHIPFKINPSGVIPIIFASAIIMLPAQLSSIVHAKWLNGILMFFAHGSWSYIAIYFLLVIGFAYLYTSVLFNPVDIAENLKRSGGFVPGIRPGTQTAEYLQGVLSRLTFAGSFFLAMIAVFPDLIMKVPLFSSAPQSLPYLMGGTSLLILIAVDLDTMKQIESRLQMHNYDGFMKKVKTYRS